MSCCGKSPTAALNERHRIQVRYLGARPIRVLGPATGREYSFSGRDRRQLVDPRDAAAMIRSQEFRAEGVVEVGDGEGQYSLESSASQE